MIYLQFLMGFILYGCMALVSYHNDFKTSNWYFPAGMSAALCANLVWFTIAKAEVSSSHLMIKGLIWDTMLMLIYLIVPLLFFEARFTTTQAVGVGLTLIGLVLTKL